MKTMKITITNNQYERSGESEYHTGAEQFFFSFGISRELTNKYLLQPDRRQRRKNSNKTYGIVEKTERLRTEVTRNINPDNHPGCKGEALLHDEPKGILSVFSEPLN